MIGSKYSTSNRINNYRTVIASRKYYYGNNINNYIRLYSKKDDDDNSNEVEDDDKKKKKSKSKSKKAKKNEDDVREVSDDATDGTDATDDIDATDAPGDDTGNDDDKEPEQEPEPLTPQQKAIAEKEKELKNQLENLENQLRKSRVDLIRVRDKISESGKNGYFIQQAQVAEFLKKKDVEQKERVERNKRDFVLKMLPVVDLFREAPTKAVANTEREEQMHKSFGSLLTSILTVFEKYGYKEFHPEIGTKYEPSKHQVNEMVVDPDNDGLILTTISSGWSSDDGDVIKRSLVNVGKKE